MIANIAPMKSRLFPRKDASRERNDSTCASGCSRSRRHQTRIAEKTVSTLMKPRKIQAIVRFCAKLCTDSIRPDRVRKVAKMLSRKVPRISSTFHIFSIPRFSWIITECRNAVPVSQGRSDAFSTGSQNQ